jgi:hypothetical protein
MKDLHQIPAYSRNGVGKEMQQDSEGYIYEWRVHVPVWTTARAVGFVYQYQPSLSLERTHSLGEDRRLLARVYLEIDDLPRRDRWMLSLYPLSGPPLPRQNEDGHYSSLKPPPRWVEPLLREGEQRSPHDSSGDAIKLALDQLADDIPRPELTAIGKVAEQLLPSFDHSSRGYAQRFRPPREPRSKDRP